MARLVRFSVGDQRRFGVRRPEHPRWREHATLSQELLPYIGHGYITMKPNIRELRGDRVAFVDGTEEALEAIIYATGYKITFPFLSLQVFDPDRQARRLYRRMVCLEHPGLIFAGLVQPIGSTIPLVERQGQWIAGFLSGKMKLPENDIRHREVETHIERQRKTYLELGALRARSRFPAVFEADGERPAKRASPSLNPGEGTCRKAAGRNDLRTPTGATSARTINSAG